MVDPDIIAMVAERKIQEGIEEGKFDDLPDRGKPLKLDDDPLTPSAMRMANRVLRNAGALPIWIQMQQSLLKERQEIAKERERLMAENRRKREPLKGIAQEDPRVMAYSLWRTRKREGYYKRLRDCNGLILKLCLSAPSSFVVPAPYRMKEEMEAFDTDFAAPA